MSELTPEERRILGHARRALRPSAKVRNRIRATVLAQASAAAAAAGSGAGAAASAGTTVSGSAGAGAAASAGTTVSGSAGAASTLAVKGGLLAGSLKATLLSVALGTTLGAGIVASMMPDATPHPSTAVSVSSPPPSRPLSTVLPSAAPAAALPTDRGAGSKGTPTPEAAWSAPKHPRPPPESRLPKARSERAELSALRHAQQARLAGQPSRALGLLRRMDSDFPQAALREEREVTRVLALCDVGSTSQARRLAQRLRETNPNTLFATRLANSCAGVAKEKSPPVAEFETLGD